MRIHLMASLVAAAAVWVAPVSLKADCHLNGPGIAAGTQKATSCPFQKDVNCEPCYKFVFTGMECKGNAGGGSGSGNGSGSYNPSNPTGGNGNNPSQHSSSYNNGYNSGYSNGCSEGYDDGYNDGRRNRNSHYHNDDNDNHHWWFWPSSSYNAGYYAGYDYGYAVNYDRGYDDGCNSNSNGALTCKATVCDNKPVPKTGTCSAQYTNVTSFNNSPNKSCSMSPSCVFRATGNTPMTCKMTWKCEGSAPKPNAIFNILAEWQKDPPPPTGSLNFAVGDWMLQQTGGDVTPDGTAKVTRE